MARRLLLEHIDVLKTMTPDEVTEEVKKSGLRGRGGAGFPAGMKWSFLAKPEGVPRYLVCNADESEPGTFKDRYLMEHLPHLLIEGMLCSSYALGANTSYIYVRGEFFYLIRILEKAIAEAYQAGWLGKNIHGTGYDLDLYVQPGGGAYICGEETALLESLEGKRGNPRIKPPFPAVKGLYGCPTVVNNVETLAAVAPIVSMGGLAYADIGIGRSTGTKLISASGHINKPGVYEIELGLPVEEFIYSDQYCGGILHGRKLKAVVAGGPGRRRLRHRHDARLGRLHRHGRKHGHRAQPVHLHPLLPSRELRPVQPVPRRHRVDGEDPAQDPRRTRHHGRHRPPVGRAVEDRGQYDLPARRRRRLARGQRDPAFPPRVRGLCAQDAPAGNIQLLRTLPGARSGARIN